MRSNRILLWIQLLFSLVAPSVLSEAIKIDSKALLQTIREPLNRARRLPSYGSYPGGYGYGKGKGKGYSYGNYGYGKSSSKSSKGKGKGGKGNKKGAKGYYPFPVGKGDGEKSVNCRKFNFLSHYKPVYGGKGKGKGYYGRRLQFDGEDCSANVLDVASQNPNLSVFVSLVSAAGLEDLFTCAGPFTVQAPSNEAFSKNPELLDFLFDPSNRDDLEETLLYHILPGIYFRNDFTNGPYRTLQRGTVEVSTVPFGFNQAVVTNADILGCNGAINIIDDILIPPGNDFLPEECAELDFRQPGEFPFETRSYGNGYDDGGMTSVFHGRKLQNSGKICDPNVLDVAREDPNLSTAVMLIETAGLEDIFLCAGPFTFLIPNNAAFSKLNADLLESLLDPANVEILRDILLYHLLAGAYFSDDFIAGDLGTLQGENLDVSLNPLTFNDGAVVQADNSACNGVYHVVDEVLIPPSIDEPTEPEVPEICDMLDFRALRRKLQFEGELCNDNVIEVARDDPELSTFVSLAEQSGIDIVFLCAGPFTALLPTNEAFGALDPALLEFLTDPANVETLQEVLLYHIVADYWPSTEIEAGPLLTLQGESVTATTNPISFNDETVLEADIAACNGLIDKLEGVLLPPTFVPPSLAPTISPTTASPTTMPTGRPTPPPGSPTEAPTQAPTGGPTAQPVAQTDMPTTLAPTRAPIVGTLEPSTAIPTGSPTTAAPDTAAPTTPVPETAAPSTAGPDTAAPSTAGPDTAAPSTAAPTTASPTPPADLTDAPTVVGSDAPSAVPTGSGTTMQPVTQGPTSTPTENLVRIRVTDYFIAYGVPGLPDEPTQEEVAQLLVTTAEFWRGYFEDFYANSPDIMFRDVILTVVETMYNAGIPEPQFNFWVEFDTVILYELDTATPPGAMETFTIMSDADFAPYIINGVRSIDGFETCDELDFRAIEMLEPASLSVDKGSGAVEGESRSTPVALLSALGAASLITILAGIVLYERKKAQERDEFGKVVLEATSGSGNTVTDETFSDSTVNSIVAALHRQKVQVSTQ